MSFARTLASALSGAFICSPPSPRRIILTLLQRPNRSPEKFGAEVRPKLGSTSPKVFQLHLPHVRCKSPVPHEDCALQTHPPHDCHRSPGLPNHHQSQELVDEIVPYFIYYTCVLLACSLRTYHSWYIATIPHLHHSFTTDETIYCEEDKKYRWPTPFQQSHDLGLLPLVKRFRIRMRPDDKFAPERFCGYNLHYFSVLTNLQELGMDNLQVPSFMPNIQQFFGNLAPTLRFLALGETEGSPRRILYFIGLFQNLQDLKFYYSFPKEDLGNAAGADLIPPSVPPLRGRLTLTYLVRFVKDIMALFEGLPFRSIDLFRVRCMHSF